MKWVGQEATTTGGSFSTTNRVYRDCWRQCFRANSSSPFALLVSYPCPPPCWSVSLRKSASKSSKMGCMLYRTRLKMCTMGRSVAHRHWRPLTRPGLAPLPRVSALARWGGALPRPLMGFALAVLDKCMTAAHTAVSDAPEASWYRGLLQARHRTVSWLMQTITLIRCSALPLMTPLLPTRSAFEYGAHGSAMRNASL